MDRKVTGGHEVGTETEKGVLHEGTGSDVQRAGAKEREDGIRRNCCAGVWYGTDEVGSVRMCD